MSSRNADFLSSIEVLVVDQMDALTMQNWEHVQVRYSSKFSLSNNLQYLQFVLSNINQMPKESHDVDFSRIKSWYLDGQ